jgi:predicted transcriptional regulator
LKLIQPLKTNALSAFRLPKNVLATVDQVCDQQDLTRSQVFRRSVMEFLKNQNVQIAEPEATRTWSPSIYKRVGQ